MKKRFLACIASAALSISACMVHVSAIGFMNPLEDLQPLDSKGMFTSEVHTNRDGNMLFCWNSIDSSYDFILKPEADSAKIEDILKSCYSDEASYDYYLMNNDDPRLVTDAGQRRYRVQDRTFAYNEHEEAVMQELLAQGMISAFYGEVKYPQVIAFEGGRCLHYSPSSDAAPTTEQIAQYVAAAGLDFTVEYYEYYDPYLTYNEVCRVTPNTEMTMAQLFTAAADIYEALGFIPEMTFPETGVLCTEMLGQNALERPGDLNIDGTADVSDAVLLARIIAEDDSMPAICDTGYLNADVDGDGLLTILDVTALLEQIADISA